MSKNVYGIVSGYCGEELLPHFISHYQKLGINHLVVSARTLDFYESAKMSANDFVDIRYTPSEHFADSDKSLVELSILNGMNLNPDDWIMHLDLDEFQEYPAPIPDIIDVMNKKNDWAIRGWIKDRVSKDGVIPARIDPDIDIRRQFPIVSDFSEKVLNAWTQKIVLCRKKVTLQGHVRHTPSNANISSPPIGRGSDYIVHHYKWHGEIVRHLRQRAEGSEGKYGSSYINECRAATRYFNANSGGFNTQDQFFDTAYIDRPSRVIKTRRDLSLLCKKIKLKKGVELGVAAGKFSITLINGHQFDEFYCVDKWNDREHDYTEAGKFMREVSGHKEVRVIPASFSETVNGFPDKYFDFIYIDGYAHTGQESGGTMRDWYPKLSLGGIMAGHDYDEKRWPKTFDQVNSFALALGKKIHVTGEIQSPSWYIIK